MASAFACAFFVHRVEGWRLVQFKIYGLGGGGGGKGGVAGGAETGEWGELLNTC